MLNPINIRLLLDMIHNVIWPQLKEKIADLLYSDGIEIPKRCGLEPTTANIYIDKSRFGVSAALTIEDFSGRQCLRQFKKKLPDPSQLLDIGDFSS